MTIGVSNNSSSKYQISNNDQIPNLNDRKNDFLCLVFYHLNLFAICNL